MKANFATFANALCHLNATPLSVAVLAPCVWGENLACGVAWQRVLNSAELGVASLATKRQSVAKFNGTAKQAQQIQCGECLWAKQAKRKWSSVWAGDFSLSLSRCSHFLASLCVKFKGLFYSFCRSFISFYHKFFLFYRSFLSSFHSQKTFFRALCFFEIFKCFVFGLLRPFCHIEPL